jgi:hypothetical protein
MLFNFSNGLANPSEKYLLLFYHSVKLTGLFNYHKLNKKGKGPKSLVVGIDSFDGIDRLEIRAVDSVSESFIRFRKYVPRFLFVIL